MADVSREVRIAFEGVDRVSAVTQKISGHIDAFAGSVQSATQPLADLTDKILKIEAALAGLAAGGMALAFKASSDFETATVSLSKILTDQQQIYIPGIRDEMIKLSNTFGQSAVAFLNGATDYKKAGFEIEDVSELVEGSARLVIAAAEAELDMNAATELLIATMKGFKSPAEDQGRLIDILNKVSNEYATNVTELATGMAVLSPVAKQMGFSFEETASILTPVIEIFRSGDLAATALRTGLLKLVSDNAKVEAALGNLEVAQKDANGQLRSGRDILFDVAIAFQSADENEKLFLASQLVGIRQASKMVEVFNNLKYTNEILQVAINATGSAQDEVTKRFQTAEIAVDRLVQSVINLGIRMGDEFRAGAKEAVDGLTLIATTIQEEVKAGSFNAIFAELERFSIALGQDFTKIAEALPEAFDQLDWSGLINSLKGLGGEIEDIFKAFFGDIDLTTAEGLRDFIQKLIDSFTALTNVSKSILNALEPFIEKLGELGDTFAKSDTDTQEFVGNILGLGKAINVLSGYVPILTGALGLFASVINTIVLLRLPALISGVGQAGVVTSGFIATLKLLAGALALPAGAALLGTWMRDNIPVVGQLNTNFTQSVLALKGLDDATINTIVSQGKHTEAMGMAAVAAVRVKEAMGELPSQLKVVGVDLALEEYFKDVDEAEARLDKIAAEKKVTIKGEADPTSLKQAEEFIIQTVPGEMKPDGTFEMITEIVFKSDEEAKEKAIKSLEEVPSEKIIIARIENQTKIEIEAIKAAAATVQTAVEWKAKINITEIEQLFSTLRAESENIAAMFESAGNVIIALSGAFENLSSYKQYELLKLIEREIEIREKLAQKQMELADAEITYLEEKTKRLAEGGEALISIQMEGIYPELELVMHRILERTQVRATQEGLDFLLGV